MTNVEALIKLAKAIGIPMPTEEKRANWPDAHGSEFLDIITLSYDNSTFIKISDATPDFEKLSSGEAYANYSTTESGSSWTTVKYDGSGIMGQGTNATIGCLEGSTPAWLVVYDKKFTTGAYGPGSEQNAPSTGIYLNINAVPMYMFNLYWYENVDLFENSIAKVLNYMAENYPKQ